MALGTPISDHQRRIVLRLLEQIGAAGDAYREQLDGATVVPGCRCGCPTFEFDALGGSPAPPPYPSTVLADGYAKSGDGHSLGVLLFVRDGRLSELEFYGYEPIEPFDLPALDTVWIWGTGPGPPMNRG